jgi:hypothetical protein
LRNGLLTIGVPNEARLRKVSVDLVVALHELQKARRFVRDGKRCMVRQRNIIDQLERRGEDTTEAILFLEYLEEMQGQYVAHRDRLESQVLGMVCPAED